MKKKPKIFEVKNRIWIDGAEGTFLGNGRVQLLEKIVESGSINKAASELKMSYRKAWSLLDSMNRQARDPFIVRKSGGAGGGGTEITKAGIRAISKFKRMNKRCQKFLDNELKKMNF